MTPTVLILAFIVIACFVAGVFLLFGGYSNLPSADKVAPAGELDKAKDDLKNANAETDKLRAQSNALAVQIEEMKGKLTWAEENVKVLEGMVNESTAAQDKLSQIEKDLSFLSQKADTQAREAIDVITRLAAENEVFQRNAEAAPAAVSSEELTRLKDENEKFKIQVEGYANKLKELEALAAAKPAETVAVSAPVANPVNDKLAEENANLKKSISELEEKIKVAQTDAEKLHAEQVKQIDELKAKIVQLESENKALTATAKTTGPSEDELKKIREESEAKLVEANAGLTALQGEIVTVKSQITEKDAHIQKLSEELRLSKEAMTVSASAKSEKEDLQKKLQDLQKMNQFLMDKEKILTFRLAQSRAQASGLEKICEEIKLQSEHK